MNLRRILATAAAAAVTTPLVLLSATPAFADAKPTAQAQQSKPTIPQLEKAAAEAQKAYDDAVLAEKAAKKILDEALSDTAPTAIAAAAANKEAAAAAAAKTAADQAVTAAKAALAALPATAAEEEKAAAQKAVTETEAAAKTAGETKIAADAKATAANKAADDARAAASKQYGLAQQATKDALAAKTAADKALADAKEEPGGGDCVPEAKLTTVVTGLPAKVVAGAWVKFQLRVTNGTDTTMDEVAPYASLHATDKSGLKVIDDLLKLQWSSATSTTWKDAGKDNYLGDITPLKAGAHSDIKLRLKVDASAPAGDGVAFVAADYFNDDDTCGGSPDLAMYEFQIQAAGSDPGKTPEPEPTTAAPTPQGGTSELPVNGTLANTGSSSAMPQLALAAGAAVVLGAGAVFVVRRRKAESAA
ncbi:LAETG motif-containing sortase-dependent surface protein [Streptomyces sp. NPDC052236]|uniref:LAETG motif-containing sortase-dependent surface protein n=1 Tax=Streptomyces sp. NPDC052236 TaxID=3365686 RepID=UPI0037D87311